MGMPIGPTSAEQAAQWAAVNAAQSPQELMAAATAAGLTADAAGIAAGGAAPVQAPSFEEQLGQYQAQNAKLEQQLASITQQFNAALSSLQNQLAGVQASVPQKVDPVTESAAKVVQHFIGLGVSDAKNLMRSALHSHLVTLGLSELAKLI